MTSPSESIGAIGQAAEMLDEANRTYLDFFASQLATSQPQTRETVEVLKGKNKVASANLLESLANLQSMVDDLVGDGGDAFSLTAISILVKHLANYHRDLAAALENAAAAIAQSKRQLASTQPSAPSFKEEKPKNTSAAGGTTWTTAAPSMPESSPVSSSCLAVAAVAASVAVSAVKPAETSDHDEVVAEKKKKKKKKKSGVDEAPPHVEVQPALPPSEPTESTGKKKKKVAEGKASAPLQASPVQTAAPQHRTEADFLSVRAGSVTTSIADAMPAFPSEFFSSFEKICRKAAVSGEYFLEVDKSAPQSLMNLGAFFTRIWLHGTVNDLYLDLLEADELTLPNFSSVTGEISVESEDELSGLPAAGFRRAFTEDITTYTCFAFVDDNGQSLRRSLIVHDVVIQGLKREEMVQIFTPVDSLIHVKYYAYNNGKKLEKNSKAEAFLVTVKEVIVEAGGVLEADAEDAARRLAEAEKPGEESLEDGAEEERPEVDDERFNTKAPDKTNFLQKAFKMSKKVVAAPLNMGVAAGAAVLDVAGGVVKTQTDGLFRKHFPQHAAEELIDSFSCALNNGPIVKQGFLYATSSWLCFKGTVLEAKVEIPMDEIREFRKANTGLVFPTAIEVHTFNDEKFLFTSFIARDDALKTLHKVWTDSDQLR
jgi:hypothetical protein